MLVPFDPKHPKSDIRSINIWFLLSSTRSIKLAKNTVIRKLIGAVSTPSFSNDFSRIYQLNLWIFNIFPDFVVFYVQKMQLQLIKYLHWLYACLHCSLLCYWTIFFNVHRLFLFCWICSITLHSIPTGIKHRT